MPQPILVTYATNAGSTQGVAETIAKELGKHGMPVEVCLLDQVQDVARYRAVVLGAPMILGWHREATGFLKKNQQALSQVPVALFFTAISLTKTGETQLDGVPIMVDPNLAKEPKKPGRLSFRENYATVRRYLGPVLRAAPQVKPVSAGFFGGKLDFTRLKLLQMLFVMLIIQAQPGDRRNWPAIQAWANELATKFGA